MSGPLGPPWTEARRVLCLGFPRQKYWSGLPFFPPGDLSDTGIESGSLALQADSLPTEPPGKPLLASKVSNSMIFDLFHLMLKRRNWMYSKQIHRIVFERNKTKLIDSHVNKHCISCSSFFWYLLSNYAFSPPESLSHTHCQELYMHMNRHLRRQWHPTPVLLPGKSHGRRSLEGCSPWGRWGSDTTEWLHFHFSLSCIGKGNSNPLQCSCLENPRDGGAWWAAVYGVAQSRTRLKWLSKWIGISVKK